MITILIVILFLVLLDIVALRWGVSSRDGIDSPEWERRRGWKGPK